VFSIENRVGRLLEIKMGGIWTTEEVVAFAMRYRDVAGAAQVPFIACSDLREARLFPPDAADQMLSFMRGRKTRIESNAILIGDSPIVGLQADRLIKGASHPGRLLVRTVGETLAFLEPMCSGAERARLREFLGPR
jgi:hypothetical protein